MKILWITNILLPDICNKIGVKTPVIGGWMASSLNSLMGNGISFGVASLYNGNVLKDYIINDVHYFLIPAPKNNNKYNISLEKAWKEVNEIFAPNLVHLHGTEYAHGLAFIKSCPNVKVIASIQGLVSVIYRYYYAGLKTKELLFNTSIRDILKNDSLFHRRINFKRSGNNEKKIIKNISNIIGRTSWDYAHTLSINPNINYNFCNETLRSNFYSHKWNYEKVDKHSIFLSQAMSPIKGLHQVIKAISLIKTKYPQIKLYIGGQNITNNDKLINKIKISGYGLFIKRLIRKHNLESRIHFLGLLNEEEIINKYLKSNIFICPSSIENSPNSLGEAQILGVPIIASYVGGIPDMVEDGKTGFLYRFEEVEMLAMLIDKVFSMDKKELMQLNESERKVALERHDPIVNRNRMLEIYNNVCNNNN